jgi:hypothetical protein
LRCIYVALSVNILHLKGAAYLEVMHLAQLSKQSLSVPNQSLNKHYQTCVVTFSQGYWLILLLDITAASCEYSATYGTSLYSAFF